MVKTLGGFPSTQEQLHIPVDFEGDPKVDHVLNLLAGGYSFSKSDWVGGDASLPKLCICKKRKRFLCTCGSSHSTERTENMKTRDITISALDTAKEIEKLRAEITMLKNMSAFCNMDKLKADLVAELTQLVHVSRLTNAHNVSSVDNAYVTNVGEQLQNASVPHDTSRECVSKNSSRSDVDGRIGKSTAGEHLRETVTFPNKCENYSLLFVASQYLCLVSLCRVLMLFAKVRRHNSPTQR